MRERASTGDSYTLASPVVEPFSPDLAAMIEAYVAARELDAVLGDPTSQPVVERGIELIASSVAQLSPVQYVNGQPVDMPARIVERPDPWSSRYAFLFATVRSMVETGGAGWYLYDADPEPPQRPRAAYVIDPGELTVKYDDKRFRRVYEWRGRTMTPGVDFAYIPLAPRAGRPEGISPVLVARRALWTIEATELYAAGYFGGSGVPSGVITSPGTLDAGEAGRLKAEFLAAHSGPTPTPAVLSGGITYEALSVDPEKSQLVESREHGVATVARVLGIPAPLLLVSTAGSSITYANVSQLYNELIRSTVAPLYLSPIEAALSDLVARNSTVRFDLGELQRLDVTARVANYVALIGAGVITPEQAARFEGLGVAVTPALAPTPAPVQTADPEVPTR